MTDRSQELWKIRRCERTGIYFTIVMDGTRVNSCTHHWIVDGPVIYAESYGPHGSVDNGICLSRIRSHGYETVTFSRTRGDEVGIAERAALVGDIAWIYADGGFQLPDRPGPGVDVNEEAHAPRPRRP